MLCLQIFLRSQPPPTSFIEIDYFSRLFCFLLALSNKIRCIVLRFMYILFNSLEVFFVFKFFIYTFIHLTLNYIYFMLFFAIWLQFKFLLISHYLNLIFFIIIIMYVELYIVNIGFYFFISKAGWLFN